MSNTGRPSLGAAAVAPLAAAAARCTLWGRGGRGAPYVHAALETRGATAVAVSDLFGDRHNRAADYGGLLARNIDAVMIAMPDRWHDEPNRCLAGGPGGLRRRPRRL